ncbi:MAG TPA: hypothetical protein ENJ09_02335 [Planctomycetes bacterium]|nr:hypothetical protein [Planctomycetota bacterium]
MVRAMWKTLSGEPVVDLVQTVRGLMRRRDCVVHVGTDSQVRGDRVHFATALAVITPGAGGRLLYRRELGARMPALAQRLFREAELSIHAARLLEHRVGRRIVVHVDANSDERHRSSRYVHALAGMVRGFGFEVRVKPHSWCASRVADHLVRFVPAQSN